MHIPEELKWLNQAYDRIEDIKKEDAALSTVEKPRSFVSWMIGKVFWFIIFSLVAVSLFDLEADSFQFILLILVSIWLIFTVRSLIRFHKERKEYKQNAERITEENRNVLERKKHIQKEKEDLEREMKQKAEKIGLPSYFLYSRDQLYALYDVSLRYPQTPISALLNIYKREKQEEEWKRKEEARIFEREQRNLRRVESERQASIQSLSDSLSRSEAALREQNKKIDSLERELWRHRQ